jgi:hypothetical protein
MDMKFEIEGMNFGGGLFDYSFTVRDTNKTNAWSIEFENDGSVIDLETIQAIESGDVFEMNFQDRGAEGVIYKFERREKKGDLHISLGLHDRPLLWTYVNFEMHQEEMVRFCKDTLREAHE